MVVSIPCWWRYKSIPSACTSFRNPIGSCKLRRSRSTLQHAAELDGDHYEILTPAADALAGKYPLAATLVLRAMIDFSLTPARSSRYRHAARHLIECTSLASTVQDFGTFEAHDAYIGRLRHEHVVFLEPDFFKEVFLGVVAFSVTRCEIASNDDPSKTLDPFALSMTKARTGWGHGWTRFCTNLLGDLRPAAMGARLPTPVVAEARPMPPDDRVRLDDDDSIKQRCLPATKPDEEPAVDGGEPGLGGRSAPQDVELMPKEDDLSLQARSRPERRGQNVRQQAEERDHLGSAYPNYTPRTVWIGFSVGTP